MRKNYLKICIGMLLFSGLVCGCNKTEDKLKTVIEKVEESDNPLPSWNDGDAK